MARPIRAEVIADTSGLAGIASAARTRSITLKAVKAGAKLIQQAAKARAPKRKRSGALKQSLGIKPAKGTRGKTVAYAVIGPRKKVSKMVPVGWGGALQKVVPAFYAHLVEGGTRPHRLRKGAKLGRKGKVDVGQDKGGMHPGAQARPFLGPAYDATRRQAQEAVEAVLAAETQKLIEKAAAKAAKGRR